MVVFILPKREKAPKLEKQFIVIGLGRFGTSVCKELYKLGHEILAIDLDLNRIDSIKDYSTQAIQANGTDEGALKVLGARNFEHAIVAIGDDLQASVLCTLMLKEMGIKHILVKARDLQHQKILEKVGADRVVQPEYDMGVRLAHYLDSEKVIDYIDISDQYSIIELSASSKVAGHTLAQLAIYTRYDCRVLALKRGDDVNITPSPDDSIQQQDVLVLIGHKRDLKRFEEKGL